METNINQTQQYCNHCYQLEESIIYGFIFVISSLGFFGNGTVIWILVFQIRRKPFTTYILNLAAADFAFLLSLELYILREIPELYFLTTTHPEVFDILYTFAVGLLAFTYNTGQLLLTAISIDRCFSVLFPIWHRCVRPTHLSTTVCALIWVLSCLLCVILNILENTSNYLPDWVEGTGQFVLIGLLCLPLMTISTVILFIKVCFKSHPQKRGRLLTVILLTLLCFLIFTFPLNVTVLTACNKAIDYAVLCASLNSSVNPLLYFLVGRRKGGHSKESLMVILQRVLNEEENDRQEMDPPCSNPLRNFA